MLGTAVLFKNKFSLLSIKKTHNAINFKRQSVTKVYIKPNNSPSQIATGVTIVRTSQRAPVPNYDHYSSLDHMVK